MNTSPTFRKVLNQSPQIDNLVRRTSASHLILMSGEEREKALNKSKNRTHDEILPNEVTVDSRTRNELVSDKRSITNNKTVDEIISNKNNNTEVFTDIAEEKRKSTILECEQKKLELSLQKTKSGNFPVHHIEGSPIVDRKYSNSFVTSSDQPIGSSEKKLVIVDSKYINISTVEESYKSKTINNVAKYGPGKDDQVVNNTRQIHMPVTGNRPSSQSNYNLPIPPVETKLKQRTKSEKSMSYESPEIETRQNVNKTLNKTQSYPLIDRSSGGHVVSSDDSKSLSSLGSLGSMGSSDDLSPTVNKLESRNETSYDRNSDCTTPEEDLSTSKCSVGSDVSNSSPDHHLDGDAKLVSKFIQVNVNANDYV